MRENWSRVLYKKEGCGKMKMRYIVKNERLNKYTLSLTLD